MVDLVVTAANVVAGVGASIKTGTAGAAISAGEALYEDATDSNSLKGAQHDGTAEEAAFVGIALNDAAVGQPVQYITSGPLTMGAILTAAQVYVVGAAPGGIAPIADLGTGDYTSIVGVATSGTVLELKPYVSGVAAA